ncbi:hypothetical protein Ddye_000671 [Dipteronia dyeriana]|uniref:Uncharacterized protein n=1 Tax=Dipteronia dyeriana TaxID=168575 RepID=A0AAE0CSR9_9ROSI|nr:hypothetical protein Ddye_000671 [Dipteronia dyeriana]
MQCSHRSCGWVLRAWKSNRRTYWHVKTFVNEHTCERNDNYNIEFKRVSATVIGDLFASKYRNPGCIIYPKDIVSKMMEQHGIHLSYNKAYKLKEHTLNRVFGDMLPNLLPLYIYLLWLILQTSISICWHVIAYVQRSVNQLTCFLPYTIGFLKHAYEMGVSPVPDPEFWDISDAIWNSIVLPWEKKPLPGRPKKLRISSAREKRKLHSCSKCGKKKTQENNLPGTII